MNLSWFLFALMILLSATNCFAQADKYKYQYVWSIDSATVYSKPTIDSEIITIVPYGKKVLQLEILDSLKTTTSFDIEEDFVGEMPVSPYWINIRYNSKEGYVKSDVLGVLPPFYRTKYGVESTEDYFSRIFRKLDVVEKEVPIIIKGETYTAHLDSVQFGNGAYKTERMFDSCIDYKYKVMGLNFYQTLNILYLTTYHESMANIGPPGEPNIQRIGYGVRMTSQEGNTFYFEGAFSAQEVYLKQLHETEYIFGHYYCI